MATTKNSSSVEKIKSLIKTKVRPMLVMDGGNIEYVSYDSGILRVKLMGSCSGCPLAALTLKNTVKRLIAEEVPELLDVEAVDFETDEEEE